MYKILVVVQITADHSEEGSATNFDTVDADTLANADIIPLYRGILVYISRI